MKSTVFILIMVLIAWMGASEYVWLCLVKGHCGGSIAGLAANPSPDSRLSTPDNGPSAVSAGDAGRTMAGVGVGDTPTTSPADGIDPLRESAGAGQLPSDPASPAEYGALADSSGRAITLLAGSDTVLRLDSVPEYSSGQWELPDGSETVSPLVAFLEEHPRVDLVITGEFLPSELNNSDFSDLGLARANALIDELSRGGIPRKRLVADSQVVARGAPGLDISAEDYTLLFSPMRVYFPRNSTDITISDDLRTFATKADQYLDRHPAAYVRLVGHTDETGAIQANYAMGLYRGREVAALLMELGVSAARLEVESAGELEPESSNDSERGRALNRRVEIQLDSR